MFSLMADMSQLASQFAHAATTVPTVAEQQVAKLAQLCVGHMKRAIRDYDAIDTGAMRNSVTAEKQSAYTYLIGPSVDYAVYVALGTSKMAARPFHLAAAKSLEPDIHQLGLRELFS